MAIDAEAGRVLEPFRKYLRVLAHVHLDARLRASSIRRMWFNKPCCERASVSISCGNATPAWSQPGCGRCCREPSPMPFAIWNGPSATSAASDRWKRH